MVDKYDLLKSAFGAYKYVTNERFAIYFPDKDKSQPPKTIDVDVFVKRALQMLDLINTGATSLPVATGIWKGGWEKTVVVYSFVDWQKFSANIGVVRAFVHEFGKEANQDAVLLEFGDAAYWISDFDA